VKPYLKKFFAVNSQLTAIGNFLAGSVLKMLVPVNERLIALTD
jgi:hypothetical protein